MRVIWTLTLTLTHSYLNQNIIFKKSKDFQILFEIWWYVRRHKRKRWRQEHKHNIESRLPRHDNRLWWHHYSPKVEHESKVLFTDQKPEHKQLRREGSPPQQIHYSAHSTASLCAWLTKELSVKYKLPGYHARDDGQRPAHCFQDVPSEAGVLVEQEGEAVAHHDHVGLRLTVGDGVLGEDEEVEEGDEVGHDETRPRVLEIVAKTGIYFHPAEPPSHTTPGSQRERARERKRERASFSQITLHSNHHGQIRVKTSLRLRLVSGK